MLQYSVDFYFQMPNVLVQYINDNLMFIKLLIRNVYDNH